MDDSQGAYGFCPACECNVRAERVDFGIGVCEFWGARSANSDWRNVCPICMGDVSLLQCEEDRYDEGDLNTMSNADQHVGAPGSGLGPIYQIGAPGIAGHQVIWWDVSQEEYERQKKAGYMKTGIVYREPSCS